MSEPTSIDKAYIAGFLDGDGGVAVYKLRNQNVYPRFVEFYNQQESVLEYIRSMFEGGKVRRLRTCYSLSFYRDFGLAVAHALKPYSVYKWQQLEVYESFSATLGTEKPGPGGAVSVQLAARRGELISKISALKHETCWNFRPDFMDLPLSERLAYIAGFVDAEGYIGIVLPKSGCHCVLLSILHTVPAVLKFIQAHFGGKISEYRRSGKRNQYRLLYERKRFVSIAEAIYPYTILKSEQIECGLQVQVSMTSRTGRPVLPEILEQREALRLRLKELNTSNWRSIL
ncbi:MAG: hypothetical protein SF029_24330 [bacterium]|nr:hypothetical protein [bacterium]